jgi:hypothetical protein
VSARAIRNLLAHFTSTGSTIVWWRMPELLDAVSPRHAG